MSVGKHNWLGGWKGGEREGGRAGGREGGRKAGRQRERETLELITKDTDQTPHHHCYAPAFYTCCSLLAWPVQIEVSNRSCPRGGLTMSPCAWSAGDVVSVERRVY
jgi:hypothetical protein